MEKETISKGRKRDKSRKERKIKGDEGKEIGFKEVVWNAWCMCVCGGRERERERERERGGIWYKPKLLHYCIIFRLTV